MTAENPSERLDQDREDLVAYLDGELDQAGCAEIEKRLAENPEFLRQLRRLQKTWDLLDTVDRPVATETFTKSTLEMVVHKETKEIRQRRGLKPMISRLAAAAVIVALAGFTGYALMQRWQDTPNRNLLRDLGAIENVDLYRSVDSLEFLTELDKSGIFEQDETSGP